MIEYKSRSLACGRNPDGSWTNPTTGDTFRPIDICDGQLIFRTWDCSKSYSEILPCPTEPTRDEKTARPRSEIYSETKIRNDYGDFYKDLPGFNPKKSIGQIQRELFCLFRRGKVDENQAFEWLLARKYDEWDKRDRNIVREYATPEGKKRNTHIWHVK